MGLLQYYCTGSDLDELLAMWSFSGYSETPLSPFFPFHTLHLPNFSPTFIFQLYLEFCEVDGWMIVYG